MHPKTRSAAVASFGLNVAKTTLDQIVDSCARAFTPTERQQLSVMIRQLETLETAVQLNAHDDSADEERALETLETPRLMDQWDGV